MLDAVVGLRAYRPGRMAGAGGGEEEGEAIRLANLELYIRRARAGLPIFEEAGQVNQRIIAGGEAMMRRLGS